MNTNFSPTFPAMPDDPFTTVKSGRAALKARQGELEEWVKSERKGKPFQPASDSTIAQYERDVKRLMKIGGNPWVAAADTTKRATWLKRKSALLSVAERKLQEFLADQDKIQRKKPAPGTVDFDTWKKVLQKVHYWTSVLESRPAPGEHVLDKVQPRKSKRVGLSRLPDDWREKIVGRMKKWRPQALITAVTGCRPSEISEGILVEIVPGGMLKVTIQGKKKGPNSGQDWRSMVWKLTDESPLVKELISMVKAAGGSMTISYAGHDQESHKVVKAFSGAMRQASKREFGESVSLVPYSMRHQFASDMKASDLPGDEISAALGHCVPLTKKVYGHHNIGKKVGGVSPAKALAEKDVKRRKTKSPPSKAQIKKKSGPKL